MRAFLPSNGAAEVSGAARVNPVVEAVLVQNARLDYRPRNPLNIGAKSHLPYNERIRNVAFGSEYCTRTVQSAKFINV